VGPTPGRRAAKSGENSAGDIQHPLVFLFSYETAYIVPGCRYVLCYDFEGEFSSFTTYQDSSLGRSSPLGNGRKTTATTQLRGCVPHPLEASVAGYCPANQDLSHLGTVPSGKCYVEQTVFMVRKPMKTDHSCTTPIVAQGRYKAPTYLT
jgi:hypothetical protein